VHIKQMDPGIVAKAEAEDLPFGRAVAMGASVEPPGGLPDIPSVLAALEQEVLQDLDAELFTVVEQDMYPCDFGKPKPIAERTHRYLTSHGLEGAA
jgi:inosose dehydratase